MFVDSHTHLYLEEFDHDRRIVVQRAIDAGVVLMLLPNIDRSSWDSLLGLTETYPDHCFPMAGLHPTSVNPATIDQELGAVEMNLSQPSICALGEIGIDLYWDKTFLAEQIEAFKIQLGWARSLQLPVVIHMRNSFNEIWQALESELSPDLKGVFHCFSGNLTQAFQVIEAGFLIGIGGVVTFKNSGLQQIVKEVGIEHLLLETDAPYLSPVPYRGQRNEPSYIPLIASRIAEITGTTLQEVARTTTSNAMNLFKITMPEGQH